MIVTAELDFLGTEIIASKKVEGKTYKQVNFLDGSYPCNILCDDISVFNAIAKLPRLAPVKAEIDIRLGRYTSAVLTGFMPVSGDGK